MKIHFLGTGGAEGIPAIRCECKHCLRAEREGGRLVRKRSAVLFSLPGYELLMDAPPDIRELLNPGGIESINGIFLTHEHFDHVGGLEEFLYWRQDVELFAEAQVYQRLIRVNWSKQFPDIAFPFAVQPGVTVFFKDFSFTPFRVHHSVPCFGLALNEGWRRVIHGADSSLRFSNYARCLIEGADVLILNTPFFGANGDDKHISVEEAVALKEKAGVKQLILTHANHFNLPHDELEAYASQFEGITVAYDGLKVEV